MKYYLGLSGSSAVSDISVNCSQEVNYRIWHYLSFCFRPGSGATLVLNLMKVSEEEVKLEETD